ncbi:MAG: tetratricopeptide repeat protein [Pirellulales bacterium]
MRRREKSSTTGTAGFSNRVLLGGCCLLMLAAAVSAVRADSAGPAAGASDVQAVLTELGEPIQPIDVLPPNSPVETRKVEALAYFGAARIRQQNQQFAAALRLYQRAHRKDPLSLPILENIVPLALHLDHDDEAVRYTLKAVELGYREPQLLRGLGLHLTNEGRWADALVMYRGLLPSVDANSDTFVALRAEMGRLAYLAERYDEAADAFADVLTALNRPADQALDAEMTAELLGDKRITYEMFADAILKAGRPEAARDVVRELKSIAGGEADDQYYLARVEVAAGHFDAALLALDAYLATQPVDRLMQPYELLGDVLLGLDRSDELLPRLTALQAEQPDNAPLAFYLGELYAAEEEWERAGGLLERVIADDPFVEAFEALVTVDLARDDAKRLADVLGRVVEVGGELSLLGDELVDKILSDQQLLSRLYTLVDADVDASLSDDTGAAGDAGAADGDADGDAGGQFGRCAAIAWLAANSGDVERAGRLFRRAIALRSAAAADLYSQWGVGLMMVERYAAAWDVFADGMRSGVTSPQNPLFNYLGSGALVMAERYDEALTAAQAAAAASPGNPRLASRVAWVLYQADRYDEANQAYVKLVTDLEDNHSSAAVRDVLRDARLVLSNLALERDDRAQAEEWLEEVLDEFPDDVSAKNDLGYLWVERGEHLDEALEMIEQAVAAQPDNPAYLDSLGWAYYRLGRFDDAVGALTRAVEGAASADGVILDHLGDAYWKAGQPERARETWRRSVEAFDSGADRDRLERVRAKTTGESPAVAQ